VFNSWYFETLASVVTLWWFFWTNYKYVFNKYWDVKILSVAATVWCYMLTILQSIFSFISRKSVGLFWWKIGQEWTPFSQLFLWRRTTNVLVWPPQPHGQTFTPSLPTSIPPCSNGVMVFLQLNSCLLYVLVHLLYSLLKRLKWNHGFWTKTPLLTCCDNS